MRAILQRVCESNVTIDGVITASIGKGLLVLLGIEDSDTNDDIDWLVAKIIQLRIFNDEAGLMNVSVQDVGGEVLLVSQFTLFASTKKGNRPSFLQASKPEIAIPLYQKCMQQFEIALNKKIQTGTFGADMKVHLINDGPVTIFIDTKNKN